MAPTISEAVADINDAIASGNFERAVAGADNLLIGLPDCARVLRARAHALERMGDTGRALEDYRRVLEILPTDHRAMVGAGRCLLSLGEPTDAAEFGAQALEYDHANRGALSLVAQGQVTDTSHTESDIEEARNLFKAGMRNRALKLMRRRLAAAPDRPDLQVIYADMLWGMGNRVLAANQCHAVLYSQPDCLPAHAILASLWREANAQFMLRQHVSALKRLDPDGVECRDWGESHPTPLQLSAPTHDESATEAERNSITRPLTDFAATVTPMVTQREPDQPSRSVVVDEPVATMVPAIPVTVPEPDSTVPGDAPPKVDAEADVLLAKEPPAPTDAPQPIEPTELAPAADEPTELAVSQRVVSTSKDETVEAAAILEQSQPHDDASNVDRAMTMIAGEPGIATDTTHSQHDKQTDGPQITGASANIAEDKVEMPPAITAVTDGAKPAESAPINPVPAHGGQPDYDQIERADWLNVLIASTPTSASTPLPDDAVIPTFDDDLLPLDDADLEAPPDGDVAPVRPLDWQPAPATSPLQAQWLSAFNRETLDAAAGLSASAPVVQSTDLPVPEWLAALARRDASPNPDVFGVTSKRLVVPPQVINTEPEPEPEVPPEVIVVPEPEPEPAPKPKRAHRKTPANHLAAARSALADGDHGLAGAIYGKLVSRNQRMADVIADLIEFNRAGAPIGALSQLLGDALMRTGRTDDAIAAYAQGLASKATQRAHPRRDSRTGKTSRRNR